MIRFFIGAIVIFSILQCQSPQTKKDEKKEEPPKPKDPFDIYSKKESNNLKKHITLGTLKIPIYSTESALVTYDSTNDANININIGSQANVNCVFSKDDYIIGTYLKNLNKKLDSSKLLMKYRLRSYKAKLINKFPSMFFLYEYITKDNLYGNLKLMITNTNARGSLICAHDEPGYIKSFQKVVKSIVDSSPVSKQFTVSGKYKQRIVYFIYLDNNPIGYTEGYSFTQGSDHLLSVSNELIVIAASDKNILTNEMKVTISSDAISGETLDYKIITHENGKKRSNLSLRKKGTKKYKVKGLFRGKPINKILKSDYDVVDSGNAITQFMRIYNQKGVDKYTFSEFNHSKPNALSNSELIYLQKYKSLHRLQYKTDENFSMNIITDNNSPTEMKFQLGEKTFRYKRVINEIK